MALIAAMPPDTIETNIKNFHLGPNNFTIGQDKRMSILSLDGAAQTTHKRDYVRWDSGRTDIAVPPAPAEVVGKDARYFNTRRSETHGEFEGYDKVQSTESVDRNKLRATNFKMDKDLSKFRLYDSTHKIDYPPKVKGLINLRSHKIYHPPKGLIDY